MCQSKMTVWLQVVLGDVLESEGQATAEEFNAKYGQDAALYVYSDVTKQDSVDGGWRKTCQFWHPWRKTVKPVVYWNVKNSRNVCLLHKVYNLKVCKQLGFCRNSGNDKGKSNIPLRTRWPSPIGFICIWHVCGGVTRASNPQQFDCFMPTGLKCGKSCHVVTPSLLTENDQHIGLWNREVPVKLQSGNTWFSWEENGNLHCCRKIIES